MAETMFRQQAIALAVADGFHVFPLARRNKVPLRDSNGLKDASDDPIVIREWWRQDPNYNIGIACGEKSNLVVIDLDGPEAADWYSQKDMPPTRKVRTGKGWHYYFRYPVGKLVCNSASKLSPGVDVRAEGGFVVAPPSIHPTGRTYQWDERHYPIADLPEWLVKRLVTTPIPPPPKNFKPRIDSGTSKIGRKILERWVDDIGSCYIGARNDTVFKAAFSIGRLVAGGEIVETEAYDALLNAAYGKGLSNHEASRTIRSGFSRSSNLPKRLN